MTIFLLPSGFAGAGVPRDKGANAALKYWQAFATLPPFTSLEQVKVLQKCQSMPLDVAAAISCARTGCRTPGSA
jgi:hypothetical protein